LACLCFHRGGRRPLRIVAEDCETAEEELALVFPLTRKFRVKGPAPGGPFIWKRLITPLHGRLDLRLWLFRAIVAAGTVRQIVRGLDLGETLQACSVNLSDGVLEGHALNFILDLAILEFPLQAE
jgi:hypothetical protein